MAFQNELPTDWTGRTAAQKIDYYNTQGITPEQLTAAGVSPEDINWMQTIGGYNVSSPAAIQQAPVTGTISANAPAVSPAPTPITPAPEPLPTPTPQQSNEDLYLQQKLKQLSTDPQWAGKTAAELRQYMASVGLTPYQHYQQYGKQEGLDWNKQSLEDIYLEQKLAQLAKDPDAKARAQQLGWTGGGTPEELKSFMQSVGLTPFEHYQKYGLQEGLQSSGFDTFGGLEDAYLQQKLDQLAKDQQAQQAAQQIGWTGSTAGELKDFMQSVGLTPYQHYQKYGKQEGLSWAQPGFEEQPKQAKLEGILSGFEALGKGEFTEDQVKNFIGQDKFKEYKDQFGGALKSGIANILADNNLSGQEVMSAVQTARKYGLDNDEISNLTGYDKKLFDAINEGYDSTVNSLVDKALEGKEGLGDKVKTNLALQFQYGLTDEDLAKASDMTTNQVKGLLDPVRDFGGKFESVTNKADVSGKDILSFLDSAKKNEAVSSVYGDKINELETKLTDLNNKWGPYDGLQTQNIYDQINKITNAVGGKNWTGSWSGQGGDSAMRTAAAMLVEKGVDNLADLKTEKTEDSEGNPIYKLIDKSTGKTIATSSDKNDFTIHSYDTGNFFKSKDKRFAIRMTDDGVPIPYQTTEKGGFLYSPVFPLMASMVLPGVGRAISGGLASAGGSSLAAGTLANTALTQGILSGGMAALTGGDVLKSALVGAAGAPISAGISSLLPTGMDPNLAKMATNIGTTAATSALAGRPMNLQGALINAGLQYGAQQLPLNLSPQQVNLLAGVATPYLQGQSISPTQLTGILANYALKSQQPQKGAR